MTQRTAPIALVAALLCSALLSQTAVAAEPIDLLAAGDLSGWDYDTKGDAPKEQVWSLEGGVLTCVGKPAGVLRTKAHYANYRLSLQWRWPVAGGNSGLLVHCTQPRQLAIWPKSLEVQLASQNAGDFWTIGVPVDVEGGDARRQGRRVLNLSDGAEKPVGDWNTMEVVCRAASIEVRVNGKLVNQGTNIGQTRGAICLQSEGTPIEFRKVMLTPLEAE